MQTLYSKLSGVTHTNPDGSDRQEIIAALTYKGQPLWLVREPNQYSYNNIGVYVAYQIGYVNPELAEELAPLIDEGVAVEAPAMPVANMAAVVAGSQAAAARVGGWQVGGRKNRRQRGLVAAVAVGSGVESGLTSACSRPPDRDCHRCLSRFCVVLVVAGRVLSPGGSYAITTILKETNLSWILSI